MDPIAELLSQLSGVRRSAGGQLNSSGPSAISYNNCRCSFWLQRQHAQAALQQLETARNATRRTNTSSVTTTITQSATTAANTESSQQTIQNSQFLLTRLNDPKMSETRRVHGKWARRPQPLCQKAPSVHFSVRRRRPQTRMNGGKWQILVLRAV